MQGDSLKNQWLRLHTLDRVDKLRELVDIYIVQHNGNMPRSRVRVVVHNRVSGFELSV